MLWVVCGLISVGICILSTLLLISVAREKELTKSQASLRESLGSAYLEIQQSNTQYEELLDRMLEQQAGMDARFAAAMTQWAAVEAPKIRAAALTKQKEVRTGYTSEAFAPFAVPGFAAEDFFRIGGSVDYLILDGADAVRDRRSNAIEQIIFLDIKTGDADLNRVQRRIRDAVVAGRVSFATFNMTTQEMRSWPQKTIETREQPQMTMAVDGVSLKDLEKPEDSN